MVKKAMIKGSVFLILLLGILSILNSIFIPKIDHRGKLIEGLYNHAQDDYDVILMGSSHMNGGIDPNVLWKQYGITSFNYATGGQSIDVTYYLLKDALKEHPNPIVVVDIYYMGMTDEYGDKGYVSNVLDNMKFSLNKLEAITQCTPPKDWISYLFPIMKYHFRWQDLTTQDFTYNSASNYYAKGFEAGVEKYGQEDANNVSASGTLELPPKSLEYLNKIIDLSKQEKFTLIFTNTPYDYKSVESNWVKDPAKLSNTVAEIAKKNDIPFIDYNNKKSEIGFDFKTDMNNSGHVNIWGAYKISLDLGKFLKGNYNLTNKLSDKAYAQWDSDYLHSQVASLLMKTSKS